MPNKMFLFGITVLAVVIIIGGLSWTLYNNSNQPLSKQNSPSNGASPEPGDQNPEATPSETTPESPSTTPTTPSDATETPNASSSTDIMPQEQIRDTTLAYVKTKHPETAPLMTNMNWTGGRIDSSTDNETYLYYSSGWSVTVEYPLTSELIYTVTGNYNSETMFVTFTAVYKNGAVNLTNYSAQKLQPQP